ncbi:hypothetical protein EK904_001633, partial [Melospiza melodia maxima]
MQRRRKTKQKTKKTSPSNTAVFSGKGSYWKKTEGTLLCYWLPLNCNFKMVTAPLQIALWVNGIMMAASTMNLLEEVYILEYWNIISHSGVMASVNPNMKQQLLTEMEVCILDPFEPLHIITNTGFNFLSFSQVGCSDGCWVQSIFSYDLRLLQDLKSAKDDYRESVKDRWGVERKKKLAVSKGKLQKNFATLKESSVVSELDSLFIGSHIIVYETLMLIRECQQVQLISTCTVSLVSYQQNCSFYKQTVPPHCRDVIGSNCSFHRMETQCVMLAQVTTALFLQRSLCFISTAP